MLSFFAAWIGDWFSVSWLAMSEEDRTIQGPTSTN
jgi:hypothetical protein